MNFWGQLLWGLHLGNGSEFFPPMWCIHQVGLPIQPYFHIPDGWLRQVTASSSGVQIGPRHFLGMYHLPPLGRQGNPTGPFHVHPKRCSLDSLEDLSLISDSTSSSQKVTCLSGLYQLGDLGCLSKDLLWGGFHCGCRGMDGGHPLPLSLAS